MSNNILKILKFTAYTGLIAIGIYAVVKGCIAKHKKNSKEKMILIAKKLNNDIKNTERKISERYHEKNQEKYEKLWGCD